MHVISKKHMGISDLSSGSYHLPTAASVLDISALLSLLLAVQYSTGAVVGVIRSDGDAVQDGPNARADSGLGTAEPLGEAFRGGGLDVDVGPVDMALIFGGHAAGRVSI